MSRFLLLFTAPGVIALSGGIAAAASKSEAEHTAHKRAAMIAKLERTYSRRLEECNHGQTAACAQANQIRGEIAQLRTER